jgi:DNA-binding MarR family transcriptional regulator
MASAEPTEETMEQVSFIVSSQYRESVVEELTDGMSTPSKIAESQDRSIAHVSRALCEMRERGLVELLVPESRKKGRIYAITDKGEEAGKHALDI